MNSQKFSDAYSDMTKRLGELMTNKPPIPTSPRRDAKWIAAVVGELERVWRRVPELRLGQLLINVFGMDFYYVEDAELIERIREFYRYAYPKMAKSQKSPRRGSKA